MSQEEKRGCGFRRAGGTYLVSDGLGEPCERLPLPLDACPTCGCGVKQSRGFQWIKPSLLFDNPKIKPCGSASDKPSGNVGLREHCHHCLVCTPNLLEAHGDPKDKLGLMWTGEKFYKTPQDWSLEAAKLGVSKRVATIPKGLVLGKTWIFVAHPKGVDEAYMSKEEGELCETLKHRFKPGIFHVFVPKRVELIVTPSMAQEDWVKEMVEKQGVTLVHVPEDDPDHAPRVKEKSARKKSIERAAQEMKLEGEGVA